MNRIGMIILVAMVGAGCAPLHKVNVNSDLYATPEVFEEKVQSLDPGMNEGEFLKALGLSTDLTKVPNLEILNPDDVWKYVYGHTEVRATPFELEQYKTQFIARYKAYRIPYTNIEKWMSTIVVTASAELETSGFDMSVVVVFENNSLWRAALEGRGKINTVETVYVWELLGDIAGGASSQGAKRAIRGF